MTLPSTSPGGWGLPRGTALPRLVCFMLKKSPGLLKWPDQLHPKLWERVRAAPRRCMPSCLHVGGSRALKEMLEHREVPALPDLLNIRDRGWRRERQVNNLSPAPCQEKLIPAAADTRPEGRGVTRRWQGTGAYPWWISKQKTWRRAVPLWAPILGYGS